MRRIDHEDDIAAGLLALQRSDRRLRPVIREAGPVPLRRSPPGFASLAAIIVSQQVSKAAADSIHRRLAGLVDPLTPENLVAAGEKAMREAGLSRPKQATMLAAAEAVLGGDLDLDDACRLPAAEAIAALTRVRGVGLWTAEVYLLFCAGHGDIFPARDVALQAAVADGLGLPARPDEKSLAAIAESWAPWRGVAARLFWAYYAARRGREAGTGRQTD